MNCHVVNKSLIAYLDEELPLAEKRSIQAHLETCRYCQQELETLKGVRISVRQHLHARAAAAVPATNAWNALQASLSSTAPRPAFLGQVFSKLSEPGGATRRAFSAQRVAILLLVMLVMIAVAPPVWARLEPIITNWFSSSSPDGESQAAIGGFEAFTPYHATYLPPGFQHSLLGSMTSIQPEIESIEIGYDSEDRFIILVQSKGTGVRGLPAGESLQVGDDPAIYIPSFATSRAAFQAKRPTVSTDTRYAYEATHLLAWFKGELKIEMFSNMPLEVMLAVADSLALMQASQGESFGP